MKKVSVIIPVYNVEKYIKKCLDSLVNQTLSDIEIIVVNDGTPDNSQIIIDEYVKKYPDKVISIVKENGGQGSARNIGLEKATGEYIGYVDSDDYVELNMYEELYGKAKENDSDIIICGNNIVYENNSKKIPEINYDNKFNNFENAFFGKMAVWNKLYKKEILINNNIKFKEKVWYEDFAFTLKTLVNAKTIDFLDKSLYNYLWREGSTMNNNNVKRNLEILDAFDDIRNYLISNDLLNKYYSYLEFNAINHIYVSTVVRVINANASNDLKKEVIDKLLEYMNSNFKDFKNNKYIKTLSMNRKIIYYLIKFKLYKLVNIIFKMKKR